MPRTADNLTPKQERFALAYVRLGDASAAYREAYGTGRMKPATINRNAHTLVHHEGIAARIEQEKRRLARRWSPEALMERFEGLADLAEQKGQIGNAARALELVGKLAGHFVERSESHVTVEKPDDHKPEAFAKALDNAEKQSKSVH